MRSSQLDGLFVNFLKQPGAARRDVLAVCGELGVSPPADYVATLEYTNGGEGFLGQSYMHLYSTNELLALNDGHQVKRFAPGLVVFGSNGGGEAYGFDTRRQPAEIVQIPFIPLDFEQAIPFGVSFTGFLERLAQIDRRLGMSTPEINLANIGKEVHQRHPLAFGGNPTDPANQALVPAAQHAELCVFWNQVYWEKKRGAG